MSIRTATAADLPAIAALERACFPPAEAASEASLAARLASFPECFYLLEERGTLCAMLNGLRTDMPDLLDRMYDDAGMHRPSGAWQMIFGVDTAPACRRQGCASRLLRHAIRRARQDGCRGVVLTCKSPLLAFYAAFGFLDEGFRGSEHGGVRWHQMRLRF